MTTLIAILGNHPHGWNSTRDAELQREKLCAIASDSERFFLVVVGIFKNEADILPEWLEHHLWQGVEHFFLIDNNSTDDWQRALAPFAKHVSVRSDPVPYQQERHVTSWLTIIQARARWAMQIDVDEFVYASPRAGFENIPAYIRHVEQTDCLSTYLLLHWQVFGSSGHTVQPPSVRINFTRAAATPPQLDQVHCPNKRLEILLGPSSTHVAQHVETMADARPATAFGFEPLPHPITRAVRSGQDDSRRREIKCLRRSKKINELL